MAKQFLAVILSLVLVTTGGALSAARVSAQTGSLMVICTGSGITTVVVDENGAPIETRQVCPECALNALTGLAQLPFEQESNRPARHAFLAAEHPALTKEFNGPVLPRGPPPT